MDMGNSDTRGFRALKSGSAILMDAQNPVYDEAGAEHHEAFFRILQLLGPQAQICRASAD